MINHINFNKIEPINYQKYDKNSARKTVNTTESLDLAGYKTGQAILARNNITFRNLSTPVEVTHLYNKKVEGKDHLDLPNIHVYEYPDTNLRVFIDENPNMKDSSIETRLYIKNIDDEKSIIKKALFLKLLKKALKKQNLDIQIEESAQGFCTLSSQANDNFNIYQQVNSLITHSDYTFSDLEEEKQNLINDIILQSPDNKITDVDLLLKHNDKKSKEEVINEIKNISRNEMVNYQKTTLEDSNATYFITLNKKDLKNYKKLIAVLNSGISIKFSNDYTSTPRTKFLLNSDDFKYIKDDNVEAYEINYPYEELSLRDNYLARFTTLLLIFLSQPYHGEESGTQFINLPMISKKPNLAYKCHNLKFSLPKPDFTRLTPQRAIEIQKEIIKMVCDTDFTITLEDLKKTFKEYLSEDINQNYKKNINNQYLYEYEYNLFNIYEIIDSINIDDIKQHIQKYIIKQEPIIKSKQNLDIIEGY